MLDKNNEQKPEGSAGSKESPGVQGQAQDSERTRRIEAFTDIRNTIVEAHKRCASYGASSFSRDIVKALKEIDCLTTELMSAADEQEVNSNITFNALLEQHRALMAIVTKRKIIYSLFFKKRIDRYFAVRTGR